LRCVDLRHAEAAISAAGQIAKSPKASTSRRRASGVEYSEPPSPRSCRLSPTRAMTALETLAQPGPLGNALICCSQPQGDLVLDL
jgi:hypothetical protein